MFVGPTKTVRSRKDLVSKDKVVEYGGSYPLPVAQNTHTHSCMHLTYSNLITTRYLGSYVLIHMKIISQLKKTDCVYTVKKI